MKIPPDSVLVDIFLARVGDLYRPSMLSVGLKNGETRIEYNIL
jgi:hypothetical protein